MKKEFLVAIAGVLSTHAYGDSQKKSHSENVIFHSDENSDSEDSDHCRVVLDSITPECLIEAAMSNVL